MKIYIYFIVYSLLLFLLGYWIPREEFFLTSLFFGICFLLYLFICLDFEFRQFSLKRGLLLALLLRLVLILSIPVLSDDFYRYFFDGQLLKFGLNPFLSTPHEISNSLDFGPKPYWDYLYEKMNSPHYYSIYPPLHQLFFFLASVTGENLLINIVFLRSFIIGFDFLNIYLLYRILILVNQPISKIWIYAFNPLIILELTGNLHFEGIVLTGILASIFFWIKKKPLQSAFGWSWAIGIKLTPLMLGPLFLLSWKKDKWIAFLFFSALMIGLIFSPLLIADGIQNFWQSARLFQSSFEFNGSIYNVVKWVSGFFVGYNPIAYVGPSLNLLAFFAIVFYSSKIEIQNSEKLLMGIVHIYLIYLLSQNVVHPWYIIPAFGVSVLTKSKIFLVWTGLVFLSYNAYSDPEVKESVILLFVEYGILLIFILKEITKNPLGRKVR